MERDVLANERDGTQLLHAVHIRRAVGSGSNAVVLLGVFPPLDPPLQRAKLSEDSSSTRQIVNDKSVELGLDIPRDRKTAVKISSHFWDEDAKRLLDCERQTLAALPHHPNIVKVYSRFKARIPTQLKEYLTPDMVTAISDPSSNYTTQCFIMEFHPITLDALRVTLPVPYPWHLLWQVAHDLMAAVVHMQTHRVAHLDLKMDNILVAYDGRCVLTDFGIARVFDDEAMTVQYKEPFDLLMNRLVLAPEVLRAYDAAKTHFRNQNASDNAAGGASTQPSSTEPGSLDIPFLRQSVWAVGIILYELAAGFAHEPGYPEDSGGVRSYYYSTATLPPLPMHYHREEPRPESAGPLTRLSDGTFRWNEVESSSTGADFETLGYPKSFVALVMSMIEADEVNRINAQDALLVLQKLRPKYAFSPAGPTAIPLPTSLPLDAPTLMIVLPDSSMVAMPLESTTVIVNSAEYGVRSATVDDLANGDVVPVLLRHVSGICRLMLIDSSLSLEAAVYAWGVAPFSRHVEQRDANPVSRTPSLGISSFPSPTGKPYIATNDVPDWGSMAELSPALLRPALFRAPSYHRQNEEDDGAPYRTKARGGVAEPVPVSAESVDTHDNDSAFQWVVNPTADDYTLAENVRNCRIFVGGCELNKEASIRSVYTYFPASEPRYASYYLNKQGDNLHMKALVLDLFPQLSAVVAHSAATLLQGLAEAHRVSEEGVTTVESSMQVLPPLPSELAAVVPSSGALPFAREQQLFQYLMEYTTPQNQRKLPAWAPAPHSVDAVEGFASRCLLSLTGLCNAALKDPTIDFPFAEAAQAAVDLHAREKLTHDTACAMVGLFRNVSCTEDVHVARLIINTGCIEVAEKLYFTAWNEASTGKRVHGDDVRYAEDAVLSVSNLIRFEQLQTLDLPFVTCIRLVAHALRHHTQLSLLVDSGIRLIKYLQKIHNIHNEREEMVYWEIASSNLLTILTNVCNRYITDKAVVELALDAIAATLVYPSCRDTQFVHVKELTETVVSIMSVPTMLEDEVIHLHCTVILRNLACIIVNPQFPLPGAFADLSPAYLITSCGAAAALEGSMERHMGNAQIQENGRCALYNLLLIGQQDMDKLLTKLTVQQQQQQQNSVNPDTAVKSSLRRSAGSEHERYATHADVTGPVITEDDVVVTVPSIANTPTATPVVVPRHKQFTMAFWIAVGLLVLAIVAVIVGFTT